ncbi:MAG: 16S rRNA (cytidine(1402)-2'-O)-methyltransferase [Vicinamibacterales bacterium]
MAGTLSIVSTPIGHLDDITLRALNVLKAVDLIAAEDTRRTAKLLSHYGITTPSVSFHEHNTRSRLPSLIRRLKAGESVALVSDAGTPVLSDPGLELVQACIEEGIQVDPIPGASAPLALAVVSGFPLFPTTLLGFPPARSVERKKWFKTLTAFPHPVTFFEAPHRIERTLAELSEISGERPIVVGRELTKVHQTVYRGTVRSVHEGGVTARGEFTVMLGPAHEAQSNTESTGVPPSDQALMAEFGELTENSGVGRREALKSLSTKHGLSTKYVYAAIERGKSR